MHRPEGTVGESVRCSIYDARPGACRELRMSWEDGAPNPQCDHARAAYGLAPLAREDVEAPGPIERRSEK